MTNNLQIVKAWAYNTALLQYSFKHHSIRRQSGVANVLEFTSFCLQLRRVMTCSMWVNDNISQYFFTNDVPEWRCLILASCLFYTITNKHYWPLYKVAFQKILKFSLNWIVSNAFNKYDRVGKCNLVWWLAVLIMYVSLLYTN